MDIFSLTNSGFLILEPLYFWRVICKLVFEGSYGMLMEKKEEEVEKKIEKKQL